MRSRPTSRRPGVSSRTPRAKGPCWRRCPRTSRSWAGMPATSAPSPRPDGAGRIQNFLADTARRLKIWIVGGTVPLRAGRGRARERVAAGLRPQTASARRATTRSTCSTSTCPAAPSRIASPRTPWPGHEARRHRHAGRASSVCRCVTTCAFRSCSAADVAAGCGDVRGAVGIHGAHRAGALGVAAARAGHRKPLRRDRAGAVGRASERARDLSAIR